MESAMNIRWMRVVLGALLLEIVLFAVLVPISFVNTTLFLIAVPVGVFAFGYLVTGWLLKKVSTRLVLHGALTGMVATAMYLGLVLAQPGGIAAAVTVYGAPLFYISQAMRIAGCVAGALHQQRRRLASSLRADV
jgi:hypothetical protein